MTAISDIIFRPPEIAPLPAKKLNQLIRLLSAGGASDGINLGGNGVDTSGSTVTPAATIEALVDEALSEYADLDLTGRALTGVGVVVLNETLELRNVNAYLELLRFQAASGFSGTLIKSGRYAGGDNSAAAIPNVQELFAWGGDRDVGINANVTLFLLETDAAPGAEYKFKGGYAGTGLRIEGNVEKKKIEARFRSVDLAVDVAQTATGSADTIEIAVTLDQYSQLAKTAYGAFGADLSVRWTGLAEGHVAKSDDRNVILDENGKATTYDIDVRTYNGQGTGAYYHFNQAANDYADTVIFGGNSRHIHMYGRTLNMESLRRPMGTFRLREAFNGRAWTGSAADGADVLCEAVFIGRVVDPGEFHLDLVAVENDVAVKYGNDTYYSIGASFGRSHVSAGPGFKPYNGEYPLTYTALHFYKALRCSFPFSQVHGKVEISAGIVDCTIRLPVEWLLIGYEMTVAAGAVFTLIIEGGCTFADATSAVWLDQITGEQVVLFECITDKGGVSAVYSRGVWKLSDPDIENALSMGAIESDLNRYFATEGLSRVNADDGLVYTFDGTDWVSSAGTITPAVMPEYTALVAHMGTTPGADYATVLDRLLYRLVAIGADTAWIAGGLLNIDNSTRALSSILPSDATATWYDLTVTGGAPAFVASQGYTFDQAGAGDAMSTGYDMTSAAEGATRDDILLLVGTRRQVNGSANNYDITAANGKAKLRGRQNAQNMSIGTTTTSGFPTGLLIPGMWMAGRVDNAMQFGVDLGRVSHQASVPSTGGAGGDPDLISLAGSREIWCWGILKASHFFANDAGTIVPIEDRALQLHRAFAEAYRAIEAI